MTKKIYLIGSLRNKEVPNVAKVLREAGFDVFDDWYAAGPEADDYWRDYEVSRGHSYSEALAGYAANHVFEFDKKHLISSDIVLLLMPCGRSGHIELGWAIGQGAKGYILFPETPERYDVMYGFTDGVFCGDNGLNELIEKLKDDQS